MTNTLRTERARLGVTQEQLANAVGVSRQSINAIETGKFVPTTILALKLAEYFSLKVEDLFILEDSD